MEIESLTIFFMWCTLINVGLFTFWMIFLVAVPGLVYRIQTRFFPLTREKYDVVICVVDEMKEKLINNFQLAANAAVVALLTCDPKFLTTYQFVGWRKRMHVVYA